MRKPTRPRVASLIGRASSLTIGPISPLTIPKITEMTISVGTPPS